MSWHTALMADEGPRDTDAGSEAGPSLELPSLRSALGLRRTRKAPRAAEPVTSAPTGATPTTADEPAVPVAHAADEPGPQISPGPVGLPEGATTGVLPASGREAPQPARRRTARASLDLHLPGPLVALLVGAVAGLALVGLTEAGLRGCTALRGTSSCGKPGILLLLAATVLTVLLGSLLLTLAGVDSAGSTSFLGVGLLVVVILLALLPVIFHWWMVIVVPVVAMATYAAAWWLTTTYVEPGERAR